LADEFLNDMDEMSHADGDADFEENIAAYQQQKAQTQKA